MEIKCASCAAANDADAKFCAGCGKAMQAICPHCGSPASGKFCGKCGGALGAAPNPPSPDDDETGLELEDLEGSDEADAPLSPAWSWAFELAPSMKGANFGAFSEGLCTVEVDGDWGYIDTNGQLVIEPRFAAADNFSGGLARVKIGGKFGFINPQGELVIPCELEDAQSFSAGLAAAKSGGQWGYLGKDGKWRIEPQFSSARSFSEGLAAVAKKEKKEEKWGYIDKQGGAAIPLEYSYAEPFSDGLASVGKATWLGYSRECIKKDGQRVFFCEFFERFSEGLAAVDSDPPSYIRKDGDKAFELDTDFRYAPIEGARDFSDGYALVNGFIQNYFIFITKDGSLNVFGHAFWAEAWPYREGLALVRKEPSGRLGYIDVDNKVAIDFIFDEAASFSEGLALVRKGQKRGFIRYTAAG